MVMIKRVDNAVYREIADAMRGEFRGVGKGVRAR